MSEQKDWNETDSTWELLGKSPSRKADRRFADDTLRAVRLLPEADPWWPKRLSFSPWVAMASCIAMAFILLIHPADDTENSVPSGFNTTNVSDQWGEIEAVAEEEMLAAAADHLDRFSDQELVTLIGF